jgi:tellurite resistance protein TerB
MQFFDELHERLRHHKSREFLEAAMAASALAAFADGTVSRPERHSIGNMIVNLRRIRIHDPKTALDILNGYIDELQNDSEAAEAALTEKLRRVANNKQTAELVAGIALAVSYADGEFVYAEKVQFQSICEVLGVDSDSIKPVSTPK